MDRRKLVIASVIGLAVAGAGGAVAATKIGSPQEESDAIVKDAAKQLGVTPEKLSDALKQALLNRVDAAVAGGRLTQEEADRIKERIESDDFPLFGGRGPHPHFRHHLDAAASYLGLGAGALRDELAQGKSLAQIARERDKSVDGLIDALLDDAKQKLDEAVSDGRLTREQANTILEHLKDRITALVNGTRPNGPPGFGFRHRGFFAPPDA